MIYNYYYIYSISQVLHGDLAARNILLADNGVAKVADFGMSRQMYYEGNYSKSGPVKWIILKSELTFRDSTFIL